MASSATNIAPLNGIDSVEEARVAEAIATLRAIRSNGSLAPANINGRISTARAIVAFLDTTTFFSWPGRYDDQIIVVSELQNLAYHEADGGGVPDIAQWCIRQYLHLLNQFRVESIEALTGLGQAWLLCAQSTLARIHRNEGSSSSGTSSGRPGSSTGRMSFTSSDDAREAIRAAVEADTRAGTPDYVEARGMLLPATEYFQRAVTAAEAANRSDGVLLSLAAEAQMSLGNVSYSHHNEQYFQQAIRYLQTASGILGFQLSPYLQSYLDDFGRLVP